MLEPSRFFSPSNLSLFRMTVPANPYEDMKEFLEALGVLGRISELQDIPLPELDLQEKAALAEVISQTHRPLGHPMTAYDLYRPLIDQLKPEAVLYVGSGPFKQIAPTYFVKAVRNAYSTLFGEEMSENAISQCSRLLGRVCDVYCRPTDHDFRHYYPKSIERPALQAHNLYLETLSTLTGHSPLSIIKHFFDDLHHPSDGDLNRYALHTLKNCPLDLIDVESLTRKQIFKKGAGTINILQLINGDFETPLQPKAALKNPWEFIFDLLTGRLHHAEMDKACVADRLFEKHDFLKMCAELVKGWIIADPEIIHQLVDVYKKEEERDVSFVKKNIKKHVPSEPASGAAMTLQILTFLPEKARLKWLRDSKDLWEHSELAEIFERAEGQTVTFINETLCLLSLNALLIGSPLIMEAGRLFVQLSLANGGPPYLLLPFLPNDALDTKDSDTLRFLSGLGVIDQEMAHSATCSDFAPRFLLRLQKKRRFHDATVIFQRLLKKIKLDVAKRYFEWEETIPVNWLPEIEPLMTTDENSVQYVTYLVRQKNAQLVSGHIRRILHQIRNDPPKKVAQILLRFCSDTLEHLDAVRAIWHAGYLNRIWWKIPKNNTTYHNLVVFLIADGYASSAPLDQLEDLFQEIIERKIPIKKMRLGKKLRKQQFQNLIKNPKLAVNPLHSFCLTEKQLDQLKLVKIKNALDNGLLMKAVNMAADLNDLPANFFDYLELMITSSPTEFVEEALSASFSRLYQTKKRKLTSLYCQLFQQLRPLKKNETLVKLLQKIEDLSEATDLPETFVRSLICFICDPDSPTNETTSQALTPFLPQVTRVLNQMGPSALEFYRHFGRHHLFGALPKKDVCHIYKTCHSRVASSPILAESIAFSMQNLSSFKNPPEFDDFAVTLALHTAFKDPSKSLKWLKRVSSFSPRHIEDIAAHLPSMQNQLRALCYEKLMIFDKDQKRAKNFALDASWDFLSGDCQLSINFFVHALDRAAHSDLVAWAFLVFLIDERSEKEMRLISSEGLQQRAHALSKCSVFLKKLENGRNTLSFSKTNTPDNPLLKTIKIDEQLRLYLSTFIVHCFGKAQVELVTTVSHWPAQKDSIKRLIFLLKFLNQNPGTADFISDKVLEQIKSTIYGHSIHLSEAKELWLQILIFYAAQKTTDLPHLTNALCNCLAISVLPNPAYDYLLKETVEKIDKHKSLSQSEKIETLIDIFRSLKKTPKSFTIYTWIKRLQGFESEDSIRCQLHLFALILENVDWINMRLPKHHLKIIHDTLEIALRHDLVDKEMLERLCRHQQIAVFLKHYHHVTHSFLSSMILSGSSDILETAETLIPTLFSPTSTLFKIYLNVIQLALSLKKGQKNDQFHRIKCYIKWLKSEKKATSILSLHLLALPVIADRLFENNRPDLYSQWLGEILSSQAADPTLIVKVIQYLVRSPYISRYLDHPSHSETLKALIRGLYCSIGKISPSEIQSALFVDFAILVIVSDNLELIKDLNLPELCHILEKTNHSAQESAPLKQLKTLNSFFTHKKDVSKGTIDPIEAVVVMKLWKFPHFNALQLGLIFLGRFRNHFYNAEIITYQRLIEKLLAHHTEIHQHFEFNVKTASAVSLSFEKKFGSSTVIDALFDCIKAAENHTGPRKYFYFILGMRFYHTPLQNMGPLELLERLTHFHATVLEDEAIYIDPSASESTFLKILGSFDSLTDEIAAAFAKYLKIQWDRGELFHNGRFYTTLLSHLESKKDFGQYDHHFRLLQCMTKEDKTLVPLEHYPCFFHSLGDVATKQYTQYLIVIGMLTKCRIALKETYPDVYSQCLKLSVKDFLKHFPISDACKITDPCSKGKTIREWHGNVLNPPSYLDITRTLMDVIAYSTGQSHAKTTLPVVIMTLQFVFRNHLISCRADEEAATIEVFDHLITLISSKGIFLDLNSPVVNEHHANDGFDVRSAYSAILESAVNRQTMRHKSPSFVSSLSVSLEKGFSNLQFKGKDLTNGYYEKWLDWWQLHLMSVFRDQKNTNSELKRLINNIELRKNASSFFKNNF